VQRGGKVISATRGGGEEGSKTKREKGGRNREAATKKTLKTVRPKERDVPAKARSSKKRPGQQWGGIGRQK